MKSTRQIFMNFNFNFIQNEQIFHYYLIGVVIVIVYSHGAN